MAVRLQVRRDTSTNWSTNNPILQVGEFGFDTTVNRFKVGIASNETSRWNVLPYLNVIPSELKELAQDFVEEAITAGTGITKSYNDTANTLTIAVDSTIANKEYVDDAIDSLGNTVTTGYIPISLLGNADGVAELDQDGYVPQTQLTNTIDQLEEYVDDAVSNLVNSAPATLDTLKELSDALGADANFATTTATALGTKITASSSDTLSNKSIDLASNTLTGTKAQFNSAITDADFATLAGTEELTNKTLNSPIINQPSGIVKADVGLGNVDNTSDETKALLYYIPSAQQTLTISSSLHLNKMIEFSNAGAITVTVPNDASDSGFPIGCMVELRQVGDGQITVQAQSPASLNATDAQLKSRVKWSTLMLEKRAANSWILTGDTTA